MLKPLNDYRGLSNPYLLRGWLAARAAKNNNNRASEIAPCSEAVPTSSSGTFQSYHTSPCTMCGREVVICDDHEASTVYPSIEDIRQIITNMRDAPAVNGVSDCPCLPAVRESQPTVPSYSHYKFKQLDATSVDTEPKDDSKETVRLREQINADPAAGPSPHYSFNQGDSTPSRSRDRGPFIVVSPVHGNFVSIPSEANLSLDMNDLCSIHSDLAGSSAGGGGGGSESTEVVLLPSAVHHVRHISKNLSVTMPPSSSSLTKTLSSMSDFTCSSMPPLTPLDTDMDCVSAKGVDEVPPFADESFEAKNDVVPYSFDDPIDGSDVSPAPASDTRNTHVSLTPSYHGAQEYSCLSVMDNLDLYFREQVFGSGLTSPYIGNKSGHETGFIAASTRPERFITLFMERIVMMDKIKSSSSKSNSKAWKPPAPGAYAPGHVSPSKSKKPDPALNPKKPRHEWDEPMMILAVTNVNVYLLKFGDGDGKVFSDAPVPVLMASHDVAELM